MQIEQERITEETRGWVREAVIGLNLCPFAAGVFADDRIRFVVSDARDPEALVDALIDELRLLADADPAQVETTLLIHPHVLADFLAFNDFLDVADEVVARLGLSGEIQVASFHPDYRFADADPADPGNATNRSPYPTLHLLREASVERAVDGFGDTDAIVRNNLRTLAGLGPQGWAALQRRWLQLR